MGMVSANKFFKFLIKYFGPLITLGVGVYSYYRLTDVVTILLAISFFGQVVVLYSNAVIIKRMRRRNLNLLKENKELTDDMNRQGW